jgi:hypothetical protein
MPRVRNSRIHEKPSPASTWTPDNHRTLNTVSNGVIIQNQKGKRVLAARRMLGNIPRHFWYQRSAVRNQRPKTTNTSSISSVVCYTGDRITLGAARIRYSTIRKMLTLAIPTVDFRNSAVNRLV